MTKHETEREAYRLEKKLEKSTDVYEYVEAKLDALAAALDAAKNEQKARLDGLAKILRRHMVLTTQNKIRQRIFLWMPDHFFLSPKEQKASIEACYYAAIDRYRRLDYKKSIYSYR